MKKLEDHVAFALALIRVEHAYEVGVVEPRDLTENGHLLLYAERAHGVLLLKDLDGHVLPITREAAPHL